MFERSGKELFDQPTLQNCKNCDVKQISWACRHLVLDNFFLLNYILFIGKSPTSGDICPEFAIIVQIAEKVASTFGDEPRFLPQQSYYRI